MKYFNRWAIKTGPARYGWKGIFMNDNRDNGDNGGLHDMRSLCGREEFSDGK